MVPPLKDDTIIPLIVDTGISETSRPADLQVSFSHVQLYVDHVEDLHVYKELEESLNRFHAEADVTDLKAQRKLWNSLWGECSEKVLAFVPQNRDVIKQLMAGFGFRVTGYRYPEAGNNCANAKTFLVTSRDLAGVQILVTSGASIQSSDEYEHFDGTFWRKFYEYHGNRQGIAVLGFQVNDVTRIQQNYEALHPNLFHSYKEYDGSKVLQVYAYYQNDPLVEANFASSKKPDLGTILRFVEVDRKDSSFCILPGLTKVDATFDSLSQPAYCDHWVSNVFSRTEFLRTLEDTLGFTPKVDFNAGVVAAGEAQIESTVTGNSSIFETGDKTAALKDQSQVYLPINNALSKVGHVHGFLKEIGQGIQHIASRVDNLVEFVERCNRMREVTGEGFTFLKIPRSYYGVLTSDYVVATAGISLKLATEILEACERNHIVSMDGAVDLTLKGETISDIMDSAVNNWSTALRDAYHEHKDTIHIAILSSRYRNLHSLLRNHISDEAYMGIVRNEILVDVQGDDILYQIFTCNILQRNVGEEAPFFEFIQRVCSECQTDDGCPVKFKPGCGGFGIRNFLTLFLSIEVSKAIREAAEAKMKGDDAKFVTAQKRVDCFTGQLNDSNPILTEISDAMTEEGRCKVLMEAAILIQDQNTADSWRKLMDLASQRKHEGNAKLMACSAHYEAMMRSIRETCEEQV